MLRPHLHPGHAGQLQQVVDERRHALAGGTYTLQGIASGIAQLGRVVLQQHLAEPVDAAEWRPQVVRHRVGERVELAVGRLQFRRAFFELPGALGDPLFQYLRVLLQLLLLFLDPAEHLVEGVGQHAQLVLAELGGAHGVVLACRRRGRGFGKREDRG